MKITVRTEPLRMRRAGSFTLSMLIHVGALGWVALEPVLPAGPPPSLYDQEIRPRETHLIWYSLKQQLPEIAPAARVAEQKTPRASVKSPESLVSGASDTKRPPQLIWAPAPRIETPRILPAPNVVALARPVRPVRSFEAPRPEPMATPPAPSLPDAPRIAAAPAAAVPLPPVARPVPKQFQAPLEAKQAPPRTVLAPAPEVAAVLTPAPAPALLPLARPVRTFVPVAAPAAPSPAPPQPVEAPPAPAIEQPPQPSLAIVSLLPDRKAEIPLPKASQEAGFSAGPRIREGGNDASPRELVIPGLLAHAEGKSQPAPTLVAAALRPPTSRENLMAAARAVNVVRGPAAADPPRVPPPPEARLLGRAVYTMAIQMPNVTSYSGSWMVWFAEHEPLPGDKPPAVQAPLPIRKVDPKYVPAAAEERIEGRVRLAAVIRKDGRVDTVEVLRGIDPRLDESAREALSKWEFQAATRDSAPIDVDAVFEIPFRLAPRSAQR